MSKVKSLATALVLFTAIPALAQSRVTKRLEAAAFDSLKVTDLDMNTLYYNDKTLEFTDWSANFAKEQEAMSLYEGYVEPTVAFVKDGVQSTRTEALMVFVGRAKMLLNKSPAAINIKKLVSLEGMGRIDKDVENVSITSTQVMSNVVANKVSPIPNFQWCNKDSVYFLRPAKEVDLSYINPKNRKWCDAADTSALCIESCYKFGTLWYEGVNVVNLGMSESEQKDYGIATQAEVRSFSDESALGLKTPLKELTGFDTPVRGGIEQNIFYFNQVMEFGKVISVLQDDPSDVNKTIMTTIFVITVKKRTYKMFGEIKKILMGKSKYFNTGSGITAGLPVFSQNTIKGIADVLEN